MAQKRIPLDPGHTYHIWTHANGDDNLFRCEENYRYFLKKYQLYIQPVAETFTYCLMPNHLHVMVRVRGPEFLLELMENKSDENEKNLQGFKNLGGLSQFVSQQISNLFNSYAKAFNKKYNRKGSLFMQNFNRKLVDSDEYFIRLITYIHYNPIHHGFTKNLHDWPFSSWNAYVMNKLTNLNKDEAMEWFGTWENFKAIHHQLNFEKCVRLFESDLR